MRIFTDFTGGNVHVLEQTGDVVRIEPELRDTMGVWFYWAFAVEGAAGRTLTFDMAPLKWVGPWGPAVSFDLVHWRWLGGGNHSRFTYTFPSDEPVYFAHDLLYHPDRFFRLAERLNLPVQTLCTSERGRKVPCVRLGEGSPAVLLSARHHCCEATGSYVLEGVLETLTKTPLPGSVLVVPFVDYDGVLDGDQGKNRAPHDHNRDYIDAPIYASIREIKKDAVVRGLQYAFDFHSPWHRGGMNDCAFVVRSSGEMLKCQQAFGQKLELLLTPDALRYRTAHDLDPETDWNKSAHMKGCLRGFMSTLPEMKLALTLETTYYGEPDNIVTQENLVAFGRCVGRAIYQTVTECSQ
ncbi:MAG: hypothetical protein ACOXZM_10785 [Eubacteriales bacterium]|jgi:hypothetical protein